VLLSQPQLNCTVLTPKLDYIFCNRWPDQLKIKNAVQGRRASKMPQVQQVCVCRRRASRRRSQVPQAMFQMWNVQQDAWLYNLRTPWDRIVLQNMSRKEIWTKGLWIWWWRCRFGHRHRRTSFEASWTRQSMNERSLRDQEGLLPITVRLCLQTCNAELSLSSRIQ